MQTHIHIDKFNTEECSKSKTHDFSTEAVLTFVTRKGEHRYINQDHYLKGDRPKKEYQRMRVITVESRCSVCKIPWSLAYNPFLME